jgi:hypothetical protein
MKKMFAAFALVSACFLFAILFAACGGDNASDSQPAAPSGSQPGDPTVFQRLPTYGKGEAFGLPDATYKLADVVFAPEYDSGGDRGYGVVFLTEGTFLPVEIPENNGQENTSVVFDDPSSPAAPISLVDLMLAEPGSPEAVSSKSAAFMGNDTGEDSEFQGKLIIFFGVGKDKKLPLSGILTREGGEDKDTVVHIDLSGIEIVNTLEPLPNGAKLLATRRQK